MGSEDHKFKRLKELSEMEELTNEQLEEFIRLENAVTVEPEEAIEPIQKYRARYEENRKKSEELGILKIQRKELELQLGIQREKKRIERAKNLLDGKVYCDDCHKWVWPSHFD